MERCAVGDGPIIKSIIVVYFISQSQRAREKAHQSLTLAHHQSRDETRSKFPLSELFHWCSLQSSRLRCRRLHLLVDRSSSRWLEAGHDNLVGLAEIVLGTVLAARGTRQSMSACPEGLGQLVGVCGRPDTLVVQPEGCEHFSTKCQRRTQMLSHFFGDIGHTLIVQQQLQLWTYLIISWVAHKRISTYLCLSPDLISLC